MTRSIFTNISILLVFILIVNHYLPSTNFSNDINSNEKTNENIINNKSNNHKNETLDSEEKSDAKYDSEEDVEGLKNKKKKKKYKDGFVEKCKCKDRDEYSEECCEDYESEEEKDKKKKKKKRKKKKKEIDGCIDSCCTSAAKDSNNKNDNDSCLGGKSSNSNSGDGDAAGAIIILAVVGAVVCAYFTATVMVPHLMETVPLYYEVDRGVHLGTEFLLFGQYMYNPTDGDTFDYLKSGYGPGAGIQFSLNLGCMFSLDYNVNYRYTTLTVTKYIESRYYDKHKLHTVSHYLGFKYTILGVYFNYNMYFSDLLKNEINYNIGVAYELLFPLIPDTGMNLTFFFKHTITFEREDNKFLKSFVSPHFFDAGIKIKFGI